MEQARPVPAPRRLGPELRPNNYENIDITPIGNSSSNNNNNNSNNINNNSFKKLNINAENLQNNCAEKSTASNQNKIVPNIGPNRTYEGTVDTSAQPIYGPDANENVPGGMGSEPIYAIPRPAPRQRARPEPQQAQPEKPPELVPPQPNHQQLGTESKVLRAAPQVPPKASNSESERRRPERCSISSEFSTTSTTFDNGHNDESLVDQSDQSRYASNASLNQSEGSQSGKFKSPSPGYVDYTTMQSEGAVEVEVEVGIKIEDEGEGTESSLTASDQSEEQFSEQSVIHEQDEQNDKNLLRSLGSTSKLLGEAIGERVAFKAKGAKKRLDKNLKSSTEAISNLSADASTRLQRVSKRLGNNFSLGRRDKGAGADCEASTSTTMGAATEFERPQTMPNKDVFNTIHFSSPLHRNAAGGGRSDLSTARAGPSVASSTPQLSSPVAEDDGSYEVPRSFKLEPKLPPSYDEALRASPVPPPVAGGSPHARNLALEATQVVQRRNQLKQQPQPAGNISDSNSEGAIRSSGDSLDLPSPPMPTFPPPTLPPLDVRQPPARQKRRKNYEDIQLRRNEVQSKSASSLEARSLYANMDSAELHALNLAAVAAERDGSFLLHTNIAAEEARIPKPERSNSWEFCCDENEDDEDESSSSPEPLYANHEATYGKVFEMATVGSNVLAPQSELTCISEEHSDGVGDLDSSEGAVGGYLALPPPPLEVIKEFDPLTSKSSTLARSKKSNELLLLEHLLEEETYGTLKREHDDISMCTSEEDSRVVEPRVKGKSNPAATQVPQATTVEDRGSKLQIVHQNAHLLSESMENMLDDEARVKPYLSRLDENTTASGAQRQVDLAPASRNRTNWFVGGNNNPSAKLNIEGDSPPTYLEAIGGDGNTSESKQVPPTATATTTTTTTTIPSVLKQTMNVFNNVKIRVSAMQRKASFKAAQRQSDVKVALQMVPRPRLSPLLVRYEGPLIRFPSGVVEDILKEMQNRKAILRDRQFQTYLDQEMKTPKECIPLDTITTLQCVSNNRVTDNSTHFYCFELTTSTPKNGNGNGSNASGSGGNGAQTMSSNPNLVMTSNSSGNCKQQRVAHLYGVGKESERGVWMQKILESLTNSLPVKYTCHYYRAGWCYLKTSITSEWSGTWLVLRKTQRRLIFVSEATGNVEKMDLRKARCIVLKESDESTVNLHVESGPMLMIDCPPYAVYMIMSSARETKIWRHIIREVAHNNGFSLADQQLTRFDVPVIVDKCINFVYIHGSMSEGIYRKSGSENSMHKLMTAFRADAFNVEITRNEYNEHDVANVLKRFMRDLPERLLGKLTESFVFVTELSAPAEKIPVYRELLARLSTIEHETLRRIVGHLVFISSQQTKNKMSVQNLTMIWGPTLLAKKSDELIYSQNEADVLSDLILLYKNLFPVSVDEMRKEQAMLSCLQKYYAAAETLKDSVKKSGDIKIWISLNPNPDNTTEEKTQVNATISPTKTAYELCREYASKMRLATHQLTLYEVILNDSLERPLHHDVRVFDVILNWSYWPEDDRKHNYLVIRPIDMLREVQRAVKNLATVTPGKELRFADSRTKTFKNLQCELRDGKIVVSKKDKNDKTTIVREVFLQSSTAYLGCERKRDFPWSWAITFVERTQAQIMRSRDAPFIGHVLAGSEWVDRTIWYSSIWYCLYGDNILPPAEIIIK